METTISPVSSFGVELDTSPAAFGRLRESGDVFGDAVQARRRMSEDGYLYFRQVLDLDPVMQARQYITSRLASEGYLDDAFPDIEAIARPGADLMFRPDLATENEPLKEVLYTGALMTFFERFLGESVLHYDYTWLRAAKPGGSSPAHCDIVYMGRGTFDVFTTWTPLGNVSVDEGPLMILEESHRKRDIIADYLKRDVDSYCVNGPAARSENDQDIPWDWDGALDHDARELRRRIGGRWLTTDFTAGDVLIFTMATIHASIDNRSNRIRLSSDSRYQAASQPADERWIGANPIGHGRAGKRGRIC